MSEPKHRVYYSGIQVRLRDDVDPPRPKWTATLVIDEHDYTEIQDWTWNGEKHKSGGWRFSNPEDKANYDAYRELIDFLVEELEYLEWKAIGPEDSELFATEKLHKKYAESQVSL